MLGVLGEWKFGVGRSGSAYAPVGVDSFDQEVLWMTTENCRSVIIEKCRSPQLAG